MGRAAPRPERRRITRASARVAGIIAGIVAAGLPARPVDAHQLDHPKVLRLGVRRERLILSVTFDTNPGQESARVRATFDRDASGALDGAEAERLERFLLDSALLFLAVRVDGAPVDLERLELVRTGFEEPVGSARSLGFAALLGWAGAELAPGQAREVVVADRDKDRTRHVPLVVDVGAGLEVAFASQGELDPHLRQLRRIMLREGAPLVLRLRGVPGAPGGS